MEEAIRKLLHGFHDFQEEYFSGNSELFDNLCHGQHPRVLVIACSDSRVDPALLTGCDPGDIFVIRNVANLVPPYEPGTGQHHGVSAALEYAVMILKVEHIIVLGHSNCGGIRTLLGRDRNSARREFLDSWLDLIEPARQAVDNSLSDASDKTRHQACEEMSLVLALENLKTFPWIKKALDVKQLSLHAWYFNLECGQLFGFDRKQREFKELITEK